MKFIIESIKRLSAFAKSRLLDNLPAIIGREGAKRSEAVSSKNGAGETLPINRNYEADRLRHSCKGPEAETVPSLDFLPSILPSDFTSQERMLIMDAYDGTLDTDAMTEQDIERFALATIGVANPAWSRKDRQTCLDMIQSQAH